MYTANAGDDMGFSPSISAFTVDVGSGALTPVSGSPYAVTPNLLSVSVEPSGTFVYFGTAGGIQAYAISQDSGALTEIPGSTFSAPGGSYAIVTTY
jgi:hypothetical protein